MRMILSAGYTFLSRVRLQPGAGFDDLASQFLVIPDGKAVTPTPHRRY
jgi:hypothetical protein